MITDFAEKVERLCGHLLDKQQDQGGLHGQEDVVALQKLKEEAADIATGYKTPMTDALEGLADALA